jgi:hypothetical protein
VRRATGRVLHLADPNPLDEAKQVRPVDLLREENQAMVGVDNNRRALRKWNELRLADAAALAYGHA